MKEALEFELEMFLAYDKTLAYCRLLWSIFLIPMLALTVPDIKAHYPILLMALIYLAYSSLVLLFKKQRIYLGMHYHYVLVTIDLIFITWINMSTLQPFGIIFGLYFISLGAFSIRSPLKPSVVMAVTAVMLHVLGLYWTHLPIQFSQIVSIIMLFTLFTLCCSVLAGKEREQSVRLAVTDGLTNLYNHRFFQQMLTHTLNLAQRSGFQVSLLILDVDNFKQINDTYGHVIGDKALQHVAEVIRHAVRTSDILARYGGEEFAVILVDCNPPYALEIGQRVCETLSNCPLVLDGKAIIPLSISGGLATFPDQTDVGVELVDMADQALYHAKRTGKNKIVMFSDEVETARMSCEF